MINQVWIVLSLVAGLVQSAHADPRWIQFKINRTKIALETNKTFDQKIDHYSSSDQRTFKQRYFIDSTLVKGNPAVAPVIYYLCGESTCDGATGTVLVNQIAKKYGAHRVALEHRYYGYSQPFATLAPANMKYLSMKQALEDLARFQHYAQEQLALQGKWIAVGGSYPGELAAFYRLKHPELVVGALASSAPVIAKDDFEEYDLHVAKVAGPNCLKAIQSAVLDTESKLKSATTALAVKKLFKSEMIRNNVDFLYVLADMAAVAIQYGFQKQFCDKIVEGLEKGKVTEAYAEIGNKLFADFGITSLQDSFQGAESINPADYLGWAGMRSWMYQSCTEFGFYQIAHSNPAYSSRSGQINLQYHHETCKRLFGLKAPVNVAKTNAEYYNNLFGAGVKNIYFTNGANDPWSNLSITEKNPNAGSNPGLKFFTIPGAAHCDDLGNRMTTALKEARDRFDQYVGQWLSE
jgi:hypothetical protein